LVTDGCEEPRLEIVRQSVALERVARLADRGRDLAATLAGNAFLSIAAAGHHTLALAIDGSLWAWGYNRYGQLGQGSVTLRLRTPMLVGEDADWATVVGRGSSAFALKRDGSLWAWGRNQRGQLGLGDEVDRYLPTRVEGC
jgi:alpha-tubulin suppressor-like RCC1 family protein